MGRAAAVYTDAGNCESGGCWTSCRMGGELGPHLTQCRCLGQGLSVHLFLFPQLTSGQFRAAVKDSVISPLLKKSI